MKKKIAQGISFRDEVVLNTAKQKADSLGLSFSAYVNQLIRGDIKENQQDTEPRETRSMGLRLTTQDRQYLENLACQCGLKASDICRIAILALIETVKENNGELRLPLKFYGKK